MYNELIYTRCRQGIDLFKPGRIISDDGFKVYTCSNALLEDGSIDMQLLYSSAQSKQSYKDPTFMDDAYLYSVPDNGPSFMIDFHPIPYDENALGDYAHRAGNFINQILVGDFSNFYPFELFGNESIWYAKTYGEAYYYENTPSMLSIRDDINDPVGQITFDEIASFVADGRKEALMKAVSFIIDQFETPIESRRFLVIRDENSRLIELWIAAIEHAFSPRIAASISFATRLDKFVTTNRYTVNQAGNYQTQINLQDPNQKKRYRAMIVGVDERDITNLTSSKSLPNSSFFVLEGIEKRLLVDSDNSNKYFDFITRFDDAHQYFCREFLQMIDIHEPSRDLFLLLDVFLAFENPLSSLNVKRVVELLSVLNRYTLFPSNRLKSIYHALISELKCYLIDDHKNAFEVINWIINISVAFGKKDVLKDLAVILCSFISEQGDSKVCNERLIALWNNIKNSDLKTEVAECFVSIFDKDKFDDNNPHLRVIDNINLVIIYLECASILNILDEIEVAKYVEHYLQICERDNDVISAVNFKKIISQNTKIDSESIFLTLARDTSDTHRNFIVKVLMESNYSVFPSENAMVSYFRKLNEEDLDQVIVSILLYRIECISSSSDIKQIYRLIKNLPQLTSKGLVVLFEALDKKININDKESISIASIIQNEKPIIAVCTYSAHIFALEAINDRKKRRNLINIFEDLKKQGFPSVIEEKYIISLTDSLLKLHLEQHELEKIIELFAKSSQYIRAFVESIIFVTTEKRSDEWNALMRVACNTQNDEMSIAIVLALSNLRLKDRKIIQLRNLLTSNEVRVYFDKISEKYNESLKSPKTQSGVKKILAIITKGNETKNKKK